MRTAICLDQGWRFTKEAQNSLPALQGEWERVDLPHCFNAVDGQDGGNDYYRGTCWYEKRICKDELPSHDRWFLEIRGANASADVYLDGNKLTHHDGGYSTWRVELTQALRQNAGREAQLLIAVDNAPSDCVYPQVADFTFYGGLYRSVYLIGVSDAHFDLSYFGGCGLTVTPRIDGQDALVDLCAYVKNMREGMTVRFSVCDHAGTCVDAYEGDAVQTQLRIGGVRLWHGKRDPYLYTAKAELLDGGSVIDAVSARFGCRSYEIDPERGFILNGEPYALRGVACHQDRWGVGNAITPAHQDEDIALICEIGATTVRAAHYQYDQRFYDLCDEKGLVVWAEIPYITNHMKTGRENTISQLTELIVQNYNHPSIVVWGISNEITMGGAADPDLLENHRILCDLAHRLDPTRKTTLACLTMCGVDEEIVHMTDVLSYNHYFGWYGGDTSMNGPWFDRFHEKYPKRAIGCSEYGCEALNWHNSSPQMGDYSEEYQAHYHEELIRQLYTRDYLWATHVWNMFDFGADARAEGGENGQNHKGLVTIDRKYKKDAFYAYKAWLSDEPFVHLCGKRYVDRVEDVTKITVYSNQPEVKLYANGELVGRQEAADHFFRFDVPNTGVTRLLAIAGSCRDESVVRKVETFNEAYRLREQGVVLNWFDITEREGYCSLNTKISEIMKPMRGKLFLMRVMLDLVLRMKRSHKKSGGKSGMSGFQLNRDLIEMVGGFTLLRISGLVGMIGVSYDKETLLAFNKRLNRIKKKDAA